MITTQVYSGQIKQLYEQRKQNILVNFPRRRFSDENLVNSFDGWFFLVRLPGVFSCHNYMKAIRSTRHWNPQSRYLPLELYTNTRLVEVTVALEIPLHLLHAITIYKGDCIDSRLVCPLTVPKCWIVLSQNSPSFYVTFRVNIAIDVVNLSPTQQLVCPLFSTQISIVSKKCPLNSMWRPLLCDIL